MENIEGPYSFRNISLWIDGYDDIFSDFDPRPFSHRRLSDDFLTEVKKVSREGEEQVGELILLIPANVRKSGDEEMIIKRLRQYFRKNQQALTRKASLSRRKGILFTFAGMSMMFAASFIETEGPVQWTRNALRILLEPSGWFFVWTGLDILFYSSQKERTELEFFTKMAESKIIFKPV